MFVCRWIAVLPRTGVRSQLWHSANWEGTTAAAEPVGRCGMFGPSRHNMLPGRISLALWAYFTYVHHAFLCLLGQNILEQGAYSGRVGNQVLVGNLRCLCSESGTAPALSPLILETPIGVFWPP